MIQDLSRYVGNYGKITTLDGLKKLVDVLGTQGKPVTFDIETGYSGVDRAGGALAVYDYQQFIVGFAITNDVTWARYVPVKHDFGTNIEAENVWQIMKPLLESQVVIAHNMSFEARNLRSLDWKGHGPSIDLFKGGFEDTILQSYVLSETQYHGLKGLTEHMYGYDQKEIDSLFENLKQNKKSQVRFNPLSIDDPKVINYVCDDVTWTHRLDKDRLPKVLAERKQIYTLEKEILQILVEMADTGIAVDWEGVGHGLSLYDNFYQQMENRTREMFEESTGRDLTTLNFRSHPQVRTLLFDPTDGLGLEAAQKTKKGGLDSTGDTSLETIRHQHPAVEQLLKFRQTKKMGEWFEQWAGLNHAYDERVHPNFKQTTVQSGRFACDSPNVQNIRKKWWFTTVDRDIEKFPNDKDFEDYVKSLGTNGSVYWSGNARDYLVASPGYTLLSFDYSQQELRVLAGLAKEPYLIDAFEKGIDIHKATASLMFGVPVEEVTDEQRQKGKTINFGNVYGQGPKAMGDQLGITTEEAQALFDKYFSAFTKVSEWFDEQKRVGKRRGYVESFMGRKSTIWELQSPFKQVQSKAGRLFVNIPVQGGGADITKVAMVRTKKALQAKGWWMTKVRLLMNQHDSLVFEVSNELDLAEVKSIIEPQVSFPVPGFPKFAVDWEVGQRWGSCKKWTDEPPEVVEEVSFVEENPPASSLMIQSLLIEFEHQPPADIIKALASTLKTNQGDFPVDLKIEGKKARLPFSIQPSNLLESQLTAITNGTGKVWLVA